MEKQFRHHPDNLIYINDIMIPLEDFVKENPDYKLPKGWIGREYIKGKFHRVYGGMNEKFLDKKWKEGDEYIKDYEKYKKLKEEITEKEQEEMAKKMGKLDKEQK